MTSTAAPSPSSGPDAADRRFFAFNVVVSTAALAFLFWLLVLHRGTPDASVDLHFLPAVNASFNALSATFLVMGLYFIKQKRPDLHRYMMVSALTSSALFLVSYIIYHYVHGDTKYTGEGPVRTAYLVMLASHILLSVPVVPGALAALWFAHRKAFTTHKRVTRVLFPIWLYVSVTGVLIFFMLRNAGASAAP